MTRCLSWEIAQYEITWPRYTIREVVPPPPPSEALRLPARRIGLMRSCAVQDRVYRQLVVPCSVIALVRQTGLDEWSVRNALTGLKLKGRVMSRKVKGYPVVYQRTRTEAP